MDLDSSASSDPDGEIVGFAWEFGDGTFDSTSDPSHTYAIAGTYDVTLTVLDDDGAFSSVTQSVKVAVRRVNASPTAAFSAAPDGLQVDFDGSASEDPDGTVESYAWSFGDGATEAGAKPSHTYAGAGTYTVTLTVLDDDGATGEHTASVTVREPPPPPPENQKPTASFTATPTDLTVEFDGSGSDDDDGTVEVDAWDFGDGPRPERARSRRTPTPVVARTR